MNPSPTRGPSPPRKVTTTSPRAVTAVPRAPSAVRTGRPLRSCLSGPGWEGGRRDSTTSLEGHGRHPDEGRPPSQPDRGAARARPLRKVLTDSVLHPTHLEALKTDVSPRLEGVTGRSPTPLGRYGQLSGAVCNAAREDSQGEEKATGDLQSHRRQGQQRRKEGSGCPLQELRHRQVVSGTGR